MAQDNRVSAAIAAKDLTDVSTAIASIKATLAGVLVFNLTPEERQEVNKMGSKTMAFVDNALTYAEQNPSIVPNFVDIAEARKDYVLARDLNSISQLLATLSRSIEDATMIAGGEAYNASLIFYAASKGATKSNSPGAQAIYNDLKERFPRRQTKKAATEPATPV